MRIHSAGLLLYRQRPGGPQVLLIHMGGPMWARKDTAAWSIPKGIIAPEESALSAAKREFYEETGFAISGAYEALGPFRQNSSKELTVWAMEGDCDPSKLASNTFAMEWPPKSGIMKTFPEADRADWFERRAALSKIVRGQRQVLEAFYAGHAASGSGSCD